MNYDDRVHHVMDSFMQGLINRESAMHMLKQYYGNEMADEIFNDYFNSWEKFVLMDD